MTTTNLVGADLVPLLHDLLPRSGRVAVLDEAVAAAVDAQAEGDRRSVLVDLPTVASHSVDAMLLLDGEVPRAGNTDALQVARAVDACRPGGLVAIAGPSRFGAVDATGHAFDAETAAHLLRHRGVEVVLHAAPGAAARLASRPFAGTADLATDRRPGLLDAGPLVLVAGTTPHTEGERSQRFFDSIPRKIVAASVVCTDDEQRLLLVFDSFRREWTLPGGLVDSGELPVHAATREALEEAGVRVAAGALLGVFAHDLPDRVHLIYAATPIVAEPSPQPLHTHEIDEVRWVTREQAEALLRGHMRRKLQHCLDEPGGTWAI